jgi:hypothetical protein
MAHADEDIAGTVVHPEDLADRSDSPAQDTPLRMGLRPRLLEDDAGKELFEQLTNGLGLSTR